MTINQVEGRIYVAQIPLFFANCAANKTAVTATEGVPAPPPHPSWPGASLGHARLQLNRAGDPLRADVMPMPMGDGRNKPGRDDRAIAIDA